MAQAKKTPRSFTASDAQRSRALDVLLDHDDPVVRRAAMSAVEQVMRADMAAWDKLTVQQHVLWAIKNTAGHLEHPARRETPEAKRAREDRADSLAELASIDIAATLADPRSNGIGWAAGLTKELVRNAIVAWTAKPGPQAKPISRSRRTAAEVAEAEAESKQRRDKAAFALLKASRLPPDSRSRSGGISAVSKLIGRHVGRNIEPAFEPRTKPPT